MYSAERAGFESEKKRRVGHSRVAKGTQVQIREGTQGSPLGLSQPKPKESNAAIVEAIKAALDEAQYDRAAVLLDVLTGTVPASSEDVTGLD
jgi:hypothetical protein